MRITDSLLHTFGCTGLLMLAALAPQARANVLTPGSTTTITDTDTTVLLNANLVADTGVIAFTGINSLGRTGFTGTLEEKVYKDIATGGLDFYYQLHNNSSSPDTLSRFSNVSYDGFSADVALRTDLNFVGAPAVAGTNGSRSVSGVIDNFGFSNGLGLSPGQSSDIFVVRTNATGVTLGSTQVLDGAVSTFTTYAPVATPEPASMLLMGSALLCVGVIRRRLS